jgi:hypothetical protein
MSTPNQPAWTGTDDDLVTQAHLDDPGYVNRSGGGVEDHGPVGTARRGEQQS